MYLSRSCKVGGRRLRIERNINNKLNSSMSSLINYLIKHIFTEPLPYVRDCPGHLRHIGELMFQWWGEIDTQYT